MPRGQLPGPKSNTLSSGNSSAFTALSMLGKRPKPSTAPGVLQSHEESDTKRVKREDKNNDGLSDGDEDEEYDDEEDDSKLFNGQDVPAEPTKPQK